MTNVTTRIHTTSIKYTQILERLTKAFDSILERMYVNATISPFIMSNVKIDLATSLVI